MAPVGLFQFEPGWHRAAGERPRVGRRAAGGCERGAVAVPTWPFGSEKVEMASVPEEIMLPEVPPHPANAQRTESSAIASGIRSVLY